MKKLIMVSVAIFMMAGFTTRSSAQVRIDPNAGAELVKVLTITNTTPLNFGRIGITATTPGTVVMGTNGVRTSGTGGTTTIINTGTQRAVARFDLTGTAGAVYTISIPSPIIVHTSSGTGTKSMNIDVLKVNVDDAGEVDAALATGTLVSGVSHFFMSGTLNIVTDQAIGVYTNTYPVTVDYQ